MKSKRESDRISDFETIFRKFYGPLVGFFINRGLPRADSEDLAQETLLNAYRGYDSFQGDASDATWLFIIAKNLWHNKFRYNNSKKRYGENISLDTSDNLLQEIEALSVSSGESSPLAVTLRKEQEQVIQEVVEELPLKMGRTFVLFYSAGMQHGEIAKILGIEPNTVKSHISQAKGKLIEVVRRRYPELFVGGGGDDSQAPQKRR